MFRYVCVWLNEKMRLVADDALDKMTKFIGLLISNSECLFVLGLRAALVV